MSSPSDALREEVDQEVLPSFSSPSWLPFVAACSFSSSAGACSSSFALLLTPLSDRSTVGLGGERREAGKWVSSQIFPDTERGQARACSPLSPPRLFSFCAPTKKTHAAVLWASPAAFVTVWDVQIGACPLFSQGRALV